VWVDCIRLRKAVIHNDYSNLDHKKGLPKDHAPLFREALVPIFDGNRIVAIIGVGNKETDYNDWDIHALTLLAKNAWVAIQRKRTEEELRDSESLYRQMFVDHSAIMLLLDPVSGAIIEANPAASKFYGYSVNELQSMNISEINMLGIEKTGVIGQEVLNRTQNCFELKHRISSGQIRDVEIHSVPIIVKGRTLLYSIIHDISDRKKAESELEEYRQNLERMVEERTTLLKETEEQLLQSQKLEAIGQLAGGLAHDMNNILTVIIGYGEQLLSDIDESAQFKKDLEQIVSAGNRAAGLTRQLLAFSRHQTLNPNILDLNTVISSMEQMLKRLIGEDILLFTYLDKKIPNVKVDSNQIEQVIMNLSVNARDAMPDGGRIFISTHCERIEMEIKTAEGTITPGDYVVIGIGDTGCGMSKETMAKIFEPFFTTKERGKGTGLGLSTVYGIVRQSGGVIRVSSEPMKGSRFDIYFPASSEKINPLPKHNVEKKRGNGEKILLVEDEKTVRDLIGIMLTKLGFSVTKAETGDAALKLVEEGFIPDLLLTDVIMPSMSGKSLSEQIQNRLSNLKILFMSGYTDNIILNQEFDDSDIHYIQKPFTKTELLRIINEIFES
jgi:PAS domain S-box-containing protein